MLFVLISFCSFLLVMTVVQVFPFPLICSKHFKIPWNAAALDKLWTSAAANEEILRTIHVIFSNFPKLHVSDAATLCIPHLVDALKCGSDAAQDSVLTTLCLLKQSWSTMSMDVSKSQAMVAAEAIPILQMLMKTCPPSFHDRADSLLHCLPGCLTVTIKRANNLKQMMGGTNAFCQLTIGNGPSRQTKVMSQHFIIVDEVQRLLLF